MAKQSGTFGLKYNACNEQCRENTGRHDYNPGLQKGSVNHYPLSMADMCQFVPELQVIISSS